MKTSATAGQTLCMHQPVKPPVLMKKNTCQSLKFSLVLLFSSLFLLLTPTHVQAAVLFVNGAAVGTNNGASWGNAFTHLQSALSVAVSGDEIWVAKGVYKPSVKLDLDANGVSEAREATFRIPNGVKVYGGFIGGEVTEEARNWVTNLTILSGDIDNNDINLDGNAIAEFTTHIIGNNAYHVVYTKNVSLQTQLDGLIITAGKAEVISAAAIDLPQQFGAGWYNHIALPENASSPTIRNCTFQGNYVIKGGAAFFARGGANASSSPVIQNSSFIQNKSDNAGGAIFIGSFQKGIYQPKITTCTFIKNEAFRSGGAIILYGDVATIDTCTFTSNKTTIISDGTGPGAGGAVYMFISSATFRKCVFNENTSTGNPSGYFEGGGGGAVYISASYNYADALGESKPALIHCSFHKNYTGGNGASWGGAIRHNSDGGVIKANYINCVFSENSAQNDGGAVANFVRVISAPMTLVPALQTNFTNCTFYKNSALKLGGAILNNGFTYLGTQILNTRIENCIFSTNTAGSGAPIVKNSGINLLKYSLLQGSGGSGAGWDATIGADGGNNIDAVPGFVNIVADGLDNIPGTSDDGLRLGFGSSAVNVGNNSAPGLIGIAKDILGNNRIWGSKVDLGAYERNILFIPKPIWYWLAEWKPYVPQCLSCPWAIQLTARSIPELQSFVWVSPAQLTITQEYALITGTVASQQNASIQFEVNIKLVKAVDWTAWSERGGTYRTYTPEAEKVARLNHPDWIFWTLSPESQLKGVKGVEGTVKLSRQPQSTTGFQWGVGANGWDGDQGLSGAFSLEGEIAIRGQKVSLTGAGSLNVDAQLCGRECSSSLATQQPSSQGQSLETALANKEMLCRFYPNPAREQLLVTPKSGSTGTYLIRLHTLRGQLVRQLQVEADKGEHTVNLQGLAPGVYQLQLVFPEGYIQHERLVIY